MDDNNARANNLHRVSDKSLNHFLVAHLNVRSLNTGFDEFANYVNDYNFDILGVSETWLSSNCCGGAYNMKGYNFVRKDRNHRGGGVGIYIRKHIRFQKVQLDVSSDYCEFVSLRFTLNNKNILFTNIYRPPSLDANNFIDCLEDMLGLTVPFYDFVIFTGDFNIDFLRQSLLLDKLLKLFEAFDLVQNISDPTRINITGNTSSLIDVIVSNKKFTVNTSHSLAISDAVSDHCLVYTDFNFPKKKK